MTGASIEALEQQVGKLSDDEAIQTLEETLRTLKARTPEFFVEQFQVARRILALLAQYDLARADTLFDVCYEGMDRRLHLANLRYWVHRDARRVVRRRELEALSQDEFDAYLALIALTPQGKPELDEQITIVDLMLAHNPRRACRIAAHWWAEESDGDREEVVGRLVDACWQSYPDEVRTLLTAWDGPQKIRWAVAWTERLVPNCSQKHIDFLAETLPNIGSSEWMEWFPEHLARWNLDITQRRTLLEALKPGWAVRFPHVLKYDYKKTWQNLIVLLWPLDSGDEWEGYLGSLLIGCEPDDRLRVARRTKHRLGGTFGQKVHREALAACCIQKARDLLSVKQIQKSHQRAWRRLARAMKLAESISDETVKMALSAEAAEIIRKVRRARRGALLRALENLDS